MRIPLVAAPAFAGGPVLLHRALSVGAAGVGGAEVRAWGMANIGWCRAAFFLEILIVDKEENHQTSFTLPPCALQQVTQTIYLLMFELFGSV